VMQAGPMSRQRFTHTHPTRSSFLARSPVPHIRPPNAHQRVDPSAPQCPATVAENRRPAATRPLRRQRQHAADACTSTATDADADADAAVRANLASGAGAGGGDWAGARLRARGARAPPHRRGRQPRYRRRREGLHGAHAVVGHRAVVRPGLHHFLDCHGRRATRGAPTYPDNVTWFSSIECSGDPQPMVPGTARSRFSIHVYGSFLTHSRLTFCFCVRALCLQRKFRFSSSLLVRHCLIRLIVSYKVKF